MCEKILESIQFFNLLAILLFIMENFKFNAQVKMLPCTNKHMLWVLNYGFLSVLHYSYLHFRITVGENCAVTCVLRCLNQSDPITMAYDYSFDWYIFIFVFPLGDWV